MCVATRHAGMSHTWQCLRAAVFQTACVCDVLPMKRHALTPKQQCIYEFIKGYLVVHWQGPYIHEIQEACGVHSYKSVVDRLVSLERKGFIKRIPNKHRSIQLIGGEPASSEAPQPKAEPIVPRMLPGSQTAPYGQGSP